jgi:hypothetical protein
MFSTTPGFQNSAEALGDGPLATISPISLGPIDGTILEQFRGETGQRSVKVMDAHITACRRCEE